MSLHTLLTSHCNMQGQQIYAAVNFDGKVVGDTKDKQKSTLKTSLFRWICPFKIYSVTRTKRFQAFLWLSEGYWHIRHEIPSAILLLRASCCFRLSKDSKELSMWCYIKWHKTPSSHCTKSTKKPGFIVWLFVFKVSEKMIGSKHDSENSYPCMNPSFFLPSHSYLFLYNAQKEVACFRQYKYLIEGRLEWIFPT